MKLNLLVAKYSLVICFTVLISGCAKKEESPVVENTTSRHPDQPSSTSASENSPAKAPVKVAAPAPPIAAVTELKMEDTKIDRVRDWAPPQNLREVR